MLCLKGWEAMKYNCLFDDVDCNIRVRLNGFIQHDNRGYYLNVFINRSDVLKLMDNDVIPTHLGNGRYRLRIGLSTKTNITMNGIQLTNLDNRYLKNAKPEEVILKELCLKRYILGTRTSKNGQCYATKMVLTIPFNKRGRK